MSSAVKSRRKPPHYSAPSRRTGVLVFWPRFLTGNNNPSGTVTVNSNSTVTSYTGGTGYSGIVNYVRPELSETKELGFNTKFDPTSRLSMIFDASWSKATNDNGGNQSWSEADYGALPN